MINKIEGKLDGKGVKVGIVISRFNTLITDELLSGAVDCLVRHGVDESGITAVYVPGSYEIPRIARKMTESKKYDGILCLGAVVRGSTPHFDYVAAEVSKGVAQVSLTSPVPVAYAVITADTLEQAFERAGSKAGNKGWDGALSLIEMINVQKAM